MRGMGLVAGTAALMTAHALGAQTFGTPAEPAIATASLTDLAALDRPGMPLSPSLNLRLGFRLDHDPRAMRAVGAVPPQLVDASRRRRVSSMLDYYPDADSGFHFTLGMHRALKRARWTPGADSGIAIFMPRLGNTLKVRTNVARSSPVMMAGWSGLLSPGVALGFAAGAMQEHGRSIRAAAIPLGAQAAIRDGWSRIGRVAQVNMSVRF